MRVSVNEVQLTALKAARGCGVQEGLAEDLARAAAWLCGAGLDGVGAALAALPGPAAPASAVCVEHAGEWRFDPASAVVAAPSALDLLVTDPERSAVLVRLDVPALVIGHAGVAAGDHAVTFAIRGEDGEGVEVSGRGFCGREALERLLRAGTLRITIIDSAPHGLPAPLDGADVDDAAFARILALAARTYVPASDASRERGAGAGLVDTD